MSLDYIKLEDKKIDFNPSQQKFFDDCFNQDGTLTGNHREYAFFGAIRCGKSYAYQLAGWLIAAKYPSTKILWVRDTYKQLQDSVIKQFNDDFERYDIYVYKKSDREAVFRNGSVIKFRAFDIDGVGMMSSEYDLIVFCQAEDISEDWFNLALGRLSGKVLPKPMMWTEGNPANTWPKRRYKDAKAEELKNKGILFIEAQTVENEKNLPQDYIENLRKNYPTEFFNRYVLGGWEQIDEMVFSEFRENTMVFITPQPTPSAKIRQGLDYGWRNPTAIVWGFIDYDAILTIYVEDGGTELTVPEIAKKALSKGKYVIAADYSIKRPDRDGKSVWTELQREGLQLLESNKDELVNIQLVNQLMKTGRLRIHSCCVNLVREIKNYKWKRAKIGSDKNLPEETVDKDNHWIDAMLYLVASLEELKIESPRQKEYKKSLLYAIQKGGRKNIAEFG